MRSCECNHPVNVFNGVCGGCLLPLEGVLHDERGTRISAEVKARQFTPLWFHHTETSDGWKDAVVRTFPEHEEAKALSDGFTKVIEYTAYEQKEEYIAKLEAENAELKNKLNVTNSNWPHEKKLHKENSALKSRIEKLESCLRSAKGFVDAHDNVGFTKVKINEALKADEEARE